MAPEVTAGGITGGLGGGNTTGGIGGIPSTGFLQQSEKWTFCPRDGKPLQAAWLFCPHCGRGIGVLTPVWWQISIPASQWGNQTIFGNQAAASGQPSAGAD